MHNKCLFKAGSNHDASTNYVDASTCYKKSDPKAAANSLQKAIDLYTESGRYVRTAKCTETLSIMRTHDNYVHRTKKIVWFSYN